MLLKSEVINDAYSLLRISGLTVEASPADKALALSRLEGLAAELETRQVDLGYNFTITPDINDAAGILLSDKYAVACVLALRLFPDFGKGKQPDVTLIHLAKSSAAYLHSSTAITRETPMPNRQPIGSGSQLRYNRYQRFYQEPEIAPNETATNNMYLGDVETFVESFSAYLNSGETISSYTIKADNGLLISEDAISSSAEKIEYTTTAEGTNEEISSNAFLRVKIVITTSAGRIVTRIVNFKITTVEI